jgi:serine/threonine-protein kinase
MLFEALSGRLPFLGSSFHQVMLQTLSAPFPSVRELRPEVPEELEQIIFKSTARDASERFADAAEFATALAPFRAQIGAATRPAAETPPQPFSQARRTTSETPLPVSSTPTQPPAPPTPRLTPGPLVAPASGAVPVVRRPARPPLRRTITAIAVGVALAVVLGVSVLVLLPRDEAAGPAPEAGASGAAVVPATTGVPLVHVRVLGVPDGARVLYDGRAVEREVDVVPAEGDHALQVNVPGRPPVLRAIRPRADLTVDLGPEMAPPSVR